MSETGRQIFDGAGEEVQPGDPLSQFYSQLLTDLPPTNPDVQAMCYSNGTTYNRYGDIVSRQSHEQLVAETARKGWRGTVYIKEDDPDEPQR